MTRSHMICMFHKEFLFSICGFRYVLTLALLLYLSMVEKYEQYLPLSINYSPPIIGRLHELAILGLEFCLQISRKVFVHQILETIILLANFTESFRASTSCWFHRQGRGPQWLGRSAAMSAQDQNIIWQDLLSSGCLPSQSTWGCLLLTPAACF